MSYLDKLESIMNLDDDGVSPVIGVILMVAITVILAAVIGAFVLDLGGSLNQNPRATIISEQGDFGTQSSDSANVHAEPDVSFRVKSMGNVEAVVVQPPKATWSNVKDGDLKDSGEFADAVSDPAGLKLSSAGAAVTVYGQNEDTDGDATVDADNLQSGDDIVLYGVMGSRHPVFKTYTVQ